MMDIQPKKHWRETPLAGLVDNDIELDPIEEKVNNTWTVVPKFSTRQDKGEIKPLPNAGLKLTPSLMTQAVQLTWQGITLPYFAASWLLYYLTYPVRCLTTKKVTKASMEILGSYGGSYLSNLRYQVGIVAVEHGVRTVCQAYQASPLATRIIVNGTTATFGGPLAMLIVSVGSWVGIKAMGFLFTKIKGVWYTVDPKDGQLKEVTDMEVSRELEKKDAEAKEMKLDKKELEALRSQIEQLQTKITDMETYSMEATG